MMLNLKRMQSKEHLKIRITGWYPKVGYVFKDTRIIEKDNFIYTTRVFDITEVEVQNYEVLFGHNDFIGFFTSKYMVPVVDVKQPFDFFYVTPSTVTSIGVCKELDIREITKKMEDDKKAFQEKEYLESLRDKISQEKLYLKSIQEDARRARSRAKLEAMRRAKLKIKEREKLKLK